MARFLTNAVALLIGFWECKGRAAKVASVVQVAAAAQVASAVQVAAAAVAAAAVAARI